MSDLFSPIELPTKHILVNRLAVAPMTTTQSNADGTVSEADVAWLERLASDGYGLVISCAAAISKTSIAFPNELSVGSDDMLPGLTNLATRLRRHRAVTVIQLCHGGSRTIPELTGTVASGPSSRVDPKRPRSTPTGELSRVQIEQIIEDFASACARAAKAGFPGVEIHGANGYLFTQFISTTTNRREDEYGGSLANRARLSRAVVQACRKRAPKGFIIGLRLSFEGGGMRLKLDIDENIQIANWLAEDGIDYVHSSQADYAAKSSKYPEKVALQYIRRKVDPRVPLICAGSVTSVSDAAKAREQGADIVAIGRAAIGNARIPERFARGKALHPWPFDEEGLLRIGVSRPFIGYLKFGHMGLVK